MEEVDSDANDVTGWVLDNFPNNVSQMEALKQAGIPPDIIFCLRDTDGHQSRKILFRFNFPFVFIPFGTRCTHFITLCIQQF